MTRYTPRIDSDEDGFTLSIPDPHTGEERYTFPLDPSHLDAFYDQVKARLGPYLREMHEARTAIERGVTLREYLEDEYRHEVQTGQHTPFECHSEDIDESGGLAADDPKSEGYHDRVVSLYDDRDKFSVKV